MQGLIVQELRTWEQTLSSQFAAIQGQFLIFESRLNELQNTALSQPIVSDSVPDSTLSERLEELQDHFVFRMSQRF